jgi:flagellar biosynthesis activator protein FlaF
MSVVTYQRAQLHTASPLTVELTAFTRVTTAMERCAAEAQGSSAGSAAATQRHVRLCDAVYQNTRLWLTLLEDLNSPTNRLTAELKGRLASLGATSVRHGRRVITGEATLQLLIDINRAIMAGLTQARLVAGRVPPAESEVRYAGSQA